MDKHTVSELAYKKGYEQGKQDAMKWISVKERLPSGRYDVLVCRTWWNERQLTQIGWYNEVAGNWYIITEDGYIVCGKVTHWMPLPAPPKGE